MILQAVLLISRLLIANSNFSACIFPLVSHHSYQPSAKMAEETEAIGKVEPMVVSELDSQHVAPGGVDIALGWFEEMRKIPNHELEAEGKAVRRRTDMILMPTICWTYALQFLDNAVLGYAYAYGILEDTVDGPP